MTLPYQTIKQMCSGFNPQIISEVPIKEEQIQPASIDLTLGYKIYRAASSFLPKPSETIEQILKEQALYEFEISNSNGAILEKQATYIVPLRESLKLPPDVYAVANTKSSIGRIDVLTRVLADYNSQFDRLPAGYSGPLYLEITPLSFPIKIFPGISLNQIRFRKLKTENYQIPDIKKLHQDYQIIYNQEQIESQGKNNIHIEDNILPITIDLKFNKIIGFRAKKDGGIIDLSKRNFYDPQNFWEEINYNPKEELILNTGDLYILSSQEKVRVPHQFAAEIISYDPCCGELRSHYAGFFDSGYGYGETGNIKGTKATLEVRNTTIPFKLSHGQVIAKMVFEYLENIPEKVYSPKAGSTYLDDSKRLSKFFKQG